MQKVLVGSSEQCSVKIANDYVSREHCVIIYESDGVWVEDLGSSNGTFVDGEKVQPNARKRVPPSSHIALAEEVILDWQEIQSFRPNRIRETGAREADRSSEGDQAHKSQNRSKSAQKQSSKRQKPKRKQQRKEEKDPQPSVQSGRDKKGDREKDSGEGKNDDSQFPLEFRPSWWNFALHILFFWLVIPLIVAIWRRMSLVLKLTDERVVLERGVLSKERKQIFMSDVRAIDVKKSFLQRIFGIGDIMIATAGTGDYEDVAEGLPNPEKIKEIVSNQRRKSDS